MPDFYGDVLREMWEHGRVAVETDWRTGQMTVVKDSGGRQGFPSGAVRDCQKGKGRYDLFRWDFYEEVALVNEAGAEKYEARNYERGIPLGRYADSAIRHLLKWLRGWRDEPHLAQAAWNIEKLWWTNREVEAGRLPPSLDDGGYRELARRRAVQLIPATLADMREDMKADLERAVKEHLVGTEITPAPEAQERNQREEAEAAARFLFDLGPLDVDTYYDEMSRRGFDAAQAWEARQQLNTVSWNVGGTIRLGYSKDAPAGVEVYA